jgi:hypothetical protein
MRVKEAFNWWSAGVIKQETHYSYFNRASESLYYYKFSIKRKRK